MPTNPQRSGALSVPPFNHAQDFTRTLVLREDFVGGSGAATLDDTATALGELGWIITDVAGSADSDIDLISTAAVVQNHPGVISLNTGPTTPQADDEGSLFLKNVDSVILPDTDSPEALYVAAIVRFPSVTAVEFNFGLFASRSAAGRGTNSVSVEFDASADAEFNLVTVKGGSATAVASTVTVAVDTWYLLEIAAHESEVQLWINGQLGAVSTATIPNDEGLGPGFKIATETTAEKSVLIDAFMLRTRLNR